MVDIIMGKLLYFILFGWWIGIIKIAWWIIRFIFTFTLGLIFIALAVPGCLFGATGFLFDGGINLIMGSVTSWGGGGGGSIGSGGNGGRYEVLRTGPEFAGHPDTSQW